MKRRELYLKMWRDCRGILHPGDAVSILGGGPAGLHLAHALSEKKLRVTVHDPHPVGGQRIPLMHACQSDNKPHELWQHAADFSRAWYKSFVHLGCVEGSDYFVIQTRRYLRMLQKQLQSMGVQFTASNPPAPDARTFIAIGHAAQELLLTTLHRGQIIPGSESYWNKQYQQKNFMTIGNRTAHIHRNAASRTDAENLAQLVLPGVRHAFFSGARLTSRDRKPIVGFMPEPEVTTYDALMKRYVHESYAPGLHKNQSPFFFCAFGYHAMTYTPFLAREVAEWLTGKNGDSQNLICTLTPARFLSRT